MTELKIGNILDLSHLQGVLEGFSEATGLATVAVDARGLPVTAPCAFTDFCKTVRSDPIRSKLCRGCDAHGGLQAAITGAPHVYRCHAGLVDFTIPVMADDTYVGAIACGQVRLPDGEQPAYITHPESWDSDRQIDSLYEQVPVASWTKIKAAARTLLELRELDGARTQDRLRLLLPITPTPPADDSPATSGSDPALAPAGGSEPAPHPAVDDLRAALDAEDLAAALVIATPLLDEAHGPQANQRQQLALIEDMILSVATDLCPRIVPHLTQAVQRSRGSRAARHNRYDTQLYVERLLSTVLDGVIRSRPRRATSIRDLLNDIARHPTRALSLTEAATRMHLSPGHLSKLFKSVTGCTFVSYVTDRRIARARLMLASTEMPVQKIAADLDFKQVNYFSRVFRSLTGMSPSEYRRAFAARNGRATGAQLQTRDHAQART